MDATTLAVLIPLVGAQLVAVIRAAKGQRDAAASIGSPNGLGTVHEALHTIDMKLDAQGARLDALEARSN